MRLALFVTMLPFCRGFVVPTITTTRIGSSLALRQSWPGYTRTLCASSSTADDATTIPWSSNSSCWRPMVNDVERISWGKPAKKKGTGSRGVPHRLNAQERLQFDLARRRGYLEVAGSAWRKQRRDAPLLNTYRSLCDARAQVAIVLHKKNTDGADQLVLDLSPLRLPKTFQAVAQACLAGLSTSNAGTIWRDEQEEEEENEVEQVNDEQEMEDSANDNDDNNNGEDPWNTRPIYQLPSYYVSWELPRSEAKALGKTMATLFQTAEGTRAASKKPVGVKAGKSRRHGGYGIG